MLSLPTFSPSPTRVRGLVSRRCPPMSIFSDGSLAGKPATISPNYTKNTASPLLPPLLDSDHCLSAIVAALSCSRVIDEATGGRASALFHFESSKEIQVQHDSHATAVLETETEFSKDAQAIREQVLK